jgi:hypothetical protein
MANNNQNIKDINNNNNNNNNNNDNSPIQRRSFLSTAFDTILTPLRDRAREQRQILIDDQQPPPQQIRDLERDIGLRTSLFGSAEEMKEETKEEDNKTKE